LFVHTLRGYVYPGTRFAPDQFKLRRRFLLHLCFAQRILAPSFRPIRNLHMEVHDAARLASSSHVESVFHGPPLATSHQPEQDSCSKGNENPSSRSGSQLGHAEYFTHAGLDTWSTSSPVSFSYPLGFGPPHISLEPSITGPILHGPTNQHNHTGHLQLAQQLIGVMGHSSSCLTLFGPLALHFYQGPSSTGLSLLDPKPSNDS